MTAQQTGAVALRSTLAVLLWVIAASCNPGTDHPDPSELAVPRPQIGQATEAVKTQVREQQQRLESLLADSSAKSNEIADAFVELGLIYTAYEFLDAAELSLANAVKLQPDDHPTLHLYGHLLSMQGKTQEADTQLSRALDQAPDDVATMVRLGKVKLQNGDRNAAQRLLQEALRRRPQSAAALEGLATIETANGNHQRAVELLEQALNQQPLANRLHYALSQSFRRLGDLERAEYHLERRGDATVLVDDPYISRVADLARSAQFFITKAGHAMQDRRYDAAAADYRRALELEPDNLNAHRALSFCLAQLGGTDAAIEQLRLAIASVPESGPTDSERIDELVNIHALLGQLLTTADDAGAALDQYRQALHLRPDRSDIRGLLADGLARSGRFGEAVEQYNSLLNSDPDNAGALVKRATARINLGQVNSAVRDFERAVDLDPADVAVRNVYADALDHIGHSAEAARQRSLAAQQAQTSNSRAMALADRAQKQRANGNLAAAAETYRQALDHDSEMSLVRFDYAGVLGELRRLDEAATQFTRVVQEQPRHGGAHRGLITAYLLQGDYAEAKLKLRDALQQLPRDAELAHALARLLATAPRADVRNAPLAVELAGRVHELNPSPLTAATLAMALAEAGRWQEALHVQREMVLGSNDQLSAEEHARQSALLDGYQQQQPARVQSPTDIITLLRRKSRS